MLFTASQQTNEENTTVEENEDTLLAGELEEPFSSNVITREDVRRSNAKWILKVGETRRLSRAATVGIVQDVADLIGGLVSRLK